MTDDGLIEASTGGEADTEYVTVLESGTPTDDDTALVQECSDTAPVQEYDDTSYPETTTGDPSAPIAFGDTSDLESGAERAGCAAGVCPHPVAHPAEAEWEQLVSAVPVEGQTDRFKPRCEGMSYPTEEDFRAAVAAVRPLDPDSFSLQRLRTGWNEEVAAVIADWPELLKTKLTALSEEWSGSDFDAFAEQIDQTRALVAGVLGDIEESVREMEHREGAIYTLQGGDSGEIPYPAPLVGVDGEWTNLVSIHVRPAWWHGDCIQMSCEEAELALELGGADPALATEVRAFIEERLGGPLTAESPLSEARVLAGEEAGTSFESRISAELAEYAERQAAIDETIEEKRAGQSEQLESMATAGEDLQCPESADPAYMDTEAPVMEQPAPPLPPQTTQDPTPVPPGGDGSVKTETTTAATEADPWETTAAGEEASGGLAAGGGSFGLGGGAGTMAAPAAGGAAPGGGYGFGASTGGMFGAPGGAAPSGGSGPGAGGGPRAAVVGSQQQQQSANDRRRRAESEEDEETEEEDLLFRETENVWGYVRPGDDPYI